MKEKLEFEEINKKWRMIDEDEWDKFKRTINDPKYKWMTNWERDMRSKNIGVQCPQPRKPWLPKEEAEVGEGRC